MTHNRRVACLFVALQLPQLRLPDSELLLLILKPFWFTGLRFLSNTETGIIRGYGLKYWNAMNGTSQVITLKEYKFSYVLRPLQKSTEYTVHLWAFTNAGKGAVGSYTAMTDEDGKR